jgi:hypothetical protein
MDQALDPPAGYDPTVWDALPHDIRQELLQSLKISQREFSGKQENQKKLQQLSLKFSTFKVIQRWKDESFPPNPGSIDGRKETSKLKSSVARQERCRCGKIMTPRQVSKVGVNQGRYFYSCSLKQCNSFLWAEGIPHRPSALNLEWKYFHPSEGWKMISSPGNYLAGLFLFTLHSVLTLFLSQTISFKGVLAIVGF